MTYEVLILFSGGADSRLLLEMALSLKKKPYCLLVDYGQSNVEELEFAKRTLNSKSIPFFMVTLSNFSVNSGLTGNKIKGQYEGVSEYNVPGRNSIFLALALSYAESHGIDEIWYGPDMDDYYNKFPDCYQSYIGKINELFSMAGSRKIKVQAPLLGFSKEMVLNFLQNIYNVSENEIYSGYERK